MEKIKLALVDDNVELTNMIKEYFSSRANIEVVNITHDGDEGFKYIKQNQNAFDVVLLDLIMPKKDGLYVLEEMQKHHINKKVIVLTSYNTQEMIRRVSELGVNYFILKPFELSELERRIMEINEGIDYENKSLDLYHHNLQISITNILHELGVPSHI